VSSAAADARPNALTERIMARPPLAAVAGALTIAFSAILVKLADVSPSTAAIFRCAYALPVLGALALWEDRRFGARPARDRLLAIPAGIFFAADLIFWHHAIADVGAGLATVLGNLQVVVIPFAAWAVLGERIERRILYALPLVCSGVLLISGVLEAGAYGAHPLRGVVFGVLTGLTYAGFILVLRHGSSDLRRPAGPLFDATAVATVAAIIAGVAVGEADLAPSWPAHAWLVTLALTSQVLGWLLIAVSLPRLPAALTSVILTLQPVGAVILGVVLLGEQPTALQLAGVACILAGLVSVARRRAPRETAAPLATTRPAGAGSGDGRAAGPPAPARARSRQG
jgi:drug/metabolite transporter (DMT)-like permease